MKNIFISILFLVLLIQGALDAQVNGLSNIRVKRIPVASLPVRLDSLTIITGSIAVYDDSTNRLLPGNYFLLRDNLFSLKDTVVGIPAEILRVGYRVLPYDLNKEYTHLDTSVMSGQEEKEWFFYDPYEEEDVSIFEAKGLKYNGSFSRGISFGNSQNLVLNSKFNLQMAGNLGDGVEVLAAITDNNIPIQPEGNTQQLNEFDRIFVQLKKNRNKIIAGDFDLLRPKGYFMNYHKKLQGGWYSNQTDLWKGKLSSDVVAAIAKGKFARNTIKGEEGNQGPYKLHGANNERFIIVFSGTEKVYIDGKLMKRGLDQDYIIDYNAGEVIFTVHQLITKDKRIVVEFEYSDRNYSRTMVAFNTHYAGEKSNLYFNAFSEQDGRKPLEGDFSKEELDILREAGDNLDNAFVRSVRRQTGDISAARVLYQLVDTFFCGGVHDSVLVYTGNPQLSKYSARFSLVGEGKGNYILDTKAGANGRVYKWVAPDCTGMPQGNYEPIIQLVAPKKHQLFTLGGDFNISKTAKIYTEIGLSNNDKNRISPLEGGDNAGIAISSGVEKKFLFTGNSTRWAINTDLKYELVQKHFSPLSPYRNPEFTRDWNLSSEGDVAPVNEHIGKAKISILRNQSLGLDYQFSGFLRGDIFKGNKHLSHIFYKKNGFNADFSSSYLHTETISEKTDFWRPKLTILKRYKHFEIGISGAEEKNRRVGLTADTLNTASFYFDLVRAYIEMPDTGAFYVKANYTKRWDYKPAGRDFLQATESDDWHFQGAWRQAKNARLSWDLTYRNLGIKDISLTNEKPVKTYLGKISYFLTLWKGVVRSNTSYELGAGQERKVQFTYIEVPAGEGVYQWRDYNRDSIPQVNEFEIAAFQDSATFLRTAIYTDDFIRSNIAQLHQSLRIAPKILWRNAKGLKSILSRFSTQSSLQIIRKTKNHEGITAWNPLQLDIPDTSLVSLSSVIRHVLYFNRSNPKFEMQIGTNSNRNKVVLTSGYESRENLKYFVTARWNISKQIGFQATFAVGEKNNDSEFFTNKDYRLQYNNMTPKLTWQPAKNFRLIASYQSSDYHNVQQPGGEESTARDMNLELTFNKSSKTSIRAKANLINVIFSGNTNSPVGYAILQGLQKGKNYLWNIVLEQKMSKNIRLYISYDGRKTGDAGVVHIGKAQIAAVF